MEKENGKAIIRVGILTPYLFSTFDEIKKALGEKKALVQKKKYGYGIFLTFAIYVFYDLAKLVNYSINSDILYGIFFIASLSALWAVWMIYKEKRGNQVIPGLSNNSKTRPLMIDAMYSYAVQYPSTIKSKRLILELIGLITKPSGKVEADEGCHDDLALSMSFCFYCRKYDPPLMISSSRDQINDFEDVMNFNFPSTDKEFYEKELSLKAIKEKLDNSKINYVDILNIFNKNNNRGPLSR